MKVFFQGLRPALPNNAHPKLLELMQRCWDAVPSNRPSFSEISIELENLLKEVQVDLISSSLFLLCFVFPWKIMAKRKFEIPVNSLMAVYCDYF